MRILQVGPVPPAVGGQTSGGVASHTWELSTGLAALGHEVVVLADNVKVRGPVTERGIRVFGVPRRWIPRPRTITPYWSQLLEACRRTRSVAGLFVPLRYFSAARSVLETLGPDLVHIHHLEVRYACTYWAVKAEIPVITTVHSLSSVNHGEKAESYRKLVCRNAADGGPLIFVSPELMETFAQQIPATTGARHVIPNGLDCTFFKPGPRDSARARLGFPQKTTLTLIGSPLEHKGAFVLARATSTLVKKGYDLHLAIVGDGPEAICFQSLLVDLNLSERTTWRRRIGREQLPLWYNAADLFVMPSRGESFGLVYLESLACGTPVVAVDHAVPAGVIPNGKVGILAPKNDPEVLASTIERALKTRWDRETLVTHSGAFDWAKQVHKFEALYEDTIARHDPLDSARFYAGKKDNV